MHRGLVFAVLLIASVVVSMGDVVRPAPDFSWLSSGAKVASLRSLRGQPVILVVARSPRQRAFRSQVRQMERLYSRIGNTRAVAVAAFTEETGVIRSNIPFVLASNPVEVAQKYGVQGDFAIFVIGRDGNLDEATDRVLRSQRLLDIINNSYVAQSMNRRGE